MSSDGTPSIAITVVGGSYSECCHFPQWSQFFGSGLRAACAIAGRGATVRLITYVSAGDRPLLETVAATFGIDVEAAESPGSFNFEYNHSLSQPTLRHTSDAIFDLATLKVEGDKILAFGMLEGNPVVHGERVVFDPQSPYEAAPFDQNGSTAEHLAIIANASEARVLSNANDLEEAGRKLLKTAEVVVIKDGVQGAQVFTSGDVVRIPAFQARNVFLIGSGDVFSATFAYAWLAEGQNPVAAAELASRATAFYCQTTTLPIPVPLPKSFRPKVVHAGGSPKIYLAGPFFAPQELAVVEETRSYLLQQGADVFSPYHDVGLGVASFVARADLDAIRECDTVFALLENYDPGTVFEVGFAAALGKRVVAVIGSGDPKQLTMFVGTGCEIFDDFVSAIYNAVWI
jgi:hypothetical protein